MKIELAHDILARKVYEKASTEDKMILKIENLITESHQRYLERGVLMGQEDLEYISPFLDTVTISPEEEKFLEKSNRAIQARQRMINRIILVVILLLALLAVLSIWQATLARGKSRDLAIQGKKLQEQAEVLKERGIELAAQTEEAKKQTKKAKENEALALENAAEAKRQEARAVRKEKEARRAEKQAKAALAEAEIQRKNARIAERAADEERQSAIAARDEVAKKNDELASTNEALDKKTEEAIKERDAATRLRALAEVRSNSTLAIRKILEGKLVEAALLARTAYVENIANNGPKHNTDNYLALSTTVDAFEAEQERDGELDLPYYRDIQTAPIRCISTAQLPNNKKVIAYAMEDNKIRIYPIDERNRSISSRLRSLSFSNGGEYLVGGAFDGTLMLWHYNKDLKDKEKNKYNFTYEDKTKKIEYVGSVSKKTFSQIHHVSFISPPNQKQLLVFADKRKVYMASIQNIDHHKVQLNIFASLRRQTIDEENDITSISTSKDGHHIIVATKKYVTLYTLTYRSKNNQIVLSQQWQTNELKEKNTRITATAISKSSDVYLFAFGYSSGAVRLVYGPDLECVGSSQQVSACDLAYVEHKSPVTKLLFNHDASQLASAALDKSGRIWNLLNEEEEKLPLIGHDKWIWDMVYNTDQSELLTASQDRTIKNWSASSKLLYEKLGILCPECLRKEKELKRKKGNTPKGFQPINKN